MISSDLATAQYLILAPNGHSHTWFTGSPFFWVVLTVQPAAPPQAYSVHGPTSLEPVIGPKLPSLIFVLMIAWASPFGSGSRGSGS